MAMLQNKRRGRLPRIEVVDLFCGIGGLSYGMKTAGFHILAGFDIDHTCEFSYETNTGGQFIFKDIKSVTASDITPLYSKGAIRVLAGCAPCQPFSSYAFKNKDKDSNKYDLLYEFGRLIREVKPDIVTMENVPAIKSFKLKNVLGDFIALLEDEGYRVFSKIVYCPNYGIPQTRRRLVLLASKLGNIKLLPPTHSPEQYVTVRDTISNLCSLNAGDVSEDDPLHRCRKLTDLSLKRISATPEGGDWRDWDESLVLECHKNPAGKSYAAVYGRMKWDAPAPTMTTQCTSLGSGRFGHPSQNRAISAREAALFQTFPFSYRFFENEKVASLKQLSRYIGNAVPPKLGNIIADSIIKHLKSLEIL